MAKFEQKSQWALEKHEAVKRLERMREEARLFFEELKLRCVTDAETIQGLIHIESEEQDGGAFSIIAGPFTLKVSRLPSGGIKSEFHTGETLDKTETYIPLSLNGDLGYMRDKHPVPYKDMPEELMKKVLDAEAAL